MVTNIRLCGLSVSMEYETETAGGFERLLEPFLCGETGEPVLRVFVQGRNQEPECLKEPQFMMEGFAFSRDEGGRLCMKNSAFGDGYGICASDWSSLRLCAAGRRPEHLMRNLFLTAFYSRLCQFDGLFLHGALVKWKEMGILFTASSGGGKSTHAELWRSHLGAKIINGDKVFLRATGDEVRGYGSMWAGSSPYVVNDDALLKGIVVLKKGKENAIRRISLSEELLSEVGTHVFYPGWDAGLMNQALKTMDRILSQVPVYELICRPEPEAAMLVRDTVISSGKNV